jgi:hypothetical protein
MFYLQKIKNFFKKLNSKYYYMKLNNLILFKKLEKLNKILFSSNDLKKKDNLILIEYNNFHGSHLCQALLANFFKKKFGGKIVACYNYSLIVSPLKFNFFHLFHNFLDLFHLLEVG